MPTDLERIEEKHYEGEPGYCNECVSDSNYPCDVVKLVRALDELLDWAIRHDVRPEGKATCCCARCKAERVLREVAGEKP